MKRRNIQKRIKKTNFLVLAYIKKYALKRINFKMKLLQTAIKRKFQIIISKSSIYTSLSKLNITYKQIYQKKIYGNRQKLNKNVRRFKKQIKSINQNDIISMDEVSVDTHITYVKGWSQIGKRIYTPSKFHWDKISFVDFLPNFTWTRGMHLSSIH